MYCTVSQAMTRIGKRETALFLFITLHTSQRGRLEGQSEAVQFHTSTDPSADCQQKEGITGQYKGPLSIVKMPVTVVSHSYMYQYHHPTPAAAEGPRGQRSSLAIDCVGRSDKTRGSSIIFTISLGPMSTGPWLCLFGMILSGSTRLNAYKRLQASLSLAAYPREVFLIVFLILDENFLDFPPKQPHRRLGLTGEDSSIKGLGFLTGTSSRGRKTSGSGTSTIPTLKKYSSGGRQLISSLLTVKVLSRWCRQ